MSKIIELPKSSSHLLSCTQIITSIHCVVKELIENALDSSSKNVEVKLEDYGLARIEVKDSGTGINKDDIGKVAKPHCTSKISSHLDLSEVRTYGFRGEALAALCAVADLVITTKTVQEEFGFTHTFGRNGDVVSSKPFPCTQGTTVSVLNLFQNIPVRKQYYRTDKVKKDELKKIEDILIAFACIHPGIRFTLYHNRNAIWKKPIVNSVHNGLVAIFGNSIVEHMQNCEFMDEKSQVSLEVFLPKNNAPQCCGHCSASKSIVSVNERPVRMKVIDKILKDYYNKSVQNFSKARYPVCFIIIKVPPSEVDVNIEPNKTSVMLHNLDVVTEQLTALLKTLYSNEESDPQVTTNEIPKNLDNGTENSNRNKISKITHDPCMKKSEICITPAPLLASKLPNPNVKPPSKKLSRQPSDMDTPTTKRMKSSSDIYTHIKTLDSFLNSPLDVEVDKKENRDSLESFLNVTREPFNSPESSLPVNINMQSDTTISDLQNDISIQDNSASTHINADDSIASILLETGAPFKPNDKLLNVTREPFNTPVSSLPVNSNIQSDTTISDLQNVSIEDNNTSTHINADDSNASILLGTEAPFKHNDKLSDIRHETEVLNSSDNMLSVGNVNQSVTNKSNLTLGLNRKNSEDLALENGTCDLNNEILDTNSNLEFKTAKSLLLNKDTFPTKENLNPNPHINAVDTDWSRGKESAGHFQPNVILKPIAKDVQMIDNNSSKGIIEKRAASKLTSPNYRKMTAFDFFCRKYRLEVASVNPDKNSNQIAQILTEKWNSLSSDDKVIFKNMVDKDYPKNIKNKQKLGKIVIPGEKGTSIKTKKKAKKKIVERILPFDLKNIKTSFNLSHLESRNLINFISPGIWIYSHNNELNLLNTFRLQEIIVYQRLLETFKFVAEALEFPCIISNSSLGKEALEVIRQMQTSNDYNILDERITANGFQINIRKGDEEEAQIEIIGMTKSISFYGVLDLKEILLIIKEKGTSAKLSECRPKSVSLYLQREAVRMARQCPPSKKIDDVEDLLKKREFLPPDCDVCLHSKPFIHQLSNLS